MVFIRDALEASYDAARSYEFYVVNTRRQPCYDVARAAVFGTNVGETDVGVVQEQINTVRRMALARLFEMACLELRMPVRGLILDERYCDQEKLVQAFSLCAWCRPTCVIYPPKTQKHKSKFKACGYFNFCPACWSSIVAQQYQRYLAAVAEAEPDVYVTAHISEKFVEAPGIDPECYSDPQAVTAAAKRLTAAIAPFKRRLQSAWKRKIYRRTLGGCWRLVPIPADRGWRLQLRQLFLTTNGEPPVMTLPWSQVRFATTLRPTPPTADLQSVFLRFAKYPREVLTEDIDLAAAALIATAKQRLLGGSGSLRSMGSQLLRDHKAKKRKRCCE